MNLQSRVSVQWPVLVLAAVALLAVGAGAAYVGLRSKGQSSPVAAGVTSGDPAPTPAVEPQSMPIRGPMPDVVVTLAADAVQRAGITVVPVAVGMASGGARAPGVVEANAYKQVVVTPLVSGRTTRVSAELGQHVKRGQIIAQIFSPELAEAQTRYVTAQAELGAHEQQLARTEKLVTIGAASQQELEGIHAEHTARRAEVQSIASRLQLLGLSRSTIDDLGPGKSVDATTSVAAPIDGVVTKRDANVGVNVDQATNLFTIVDLSTVWVVVDIYEKDFPRVRVGSPAAVTTSAYPDLALTGRVSYIDPQVSAETRTAKVRIEVPNTGERLRLGMLAEAMLGGTDSFPTAMIPRTAVQNVGDRTVVYLAPPNEPGKFIEREVRLGGVAGEQIAVVSGIAASDIIVSKGSFSVRAEVERLGLRGAAAPRTGHESMQMSGAQQDVSVTVTDAGFEPKRVTVKTGLPVRIMFTRVSDKTCATKVVFPSLKIERDLLLNKPVAIELPAARSGEIEFVCGLNMFRGAIVVR